MTDTAGGKTMDLLPRVSGLDPYAPDSRPGTGAFARKRRQARGGQDQTGDTPETGGVSADTGVDPLLAELDRMRAIDPALTESGAHQALLALRAYHQAPAEPLTVADDLLPALLTDAASSEPGR
jgi:hypothetical protein